MQENPVPPPQDDAVYYITAKEVKRNCKTISVESTTGSFFFIAYSFLQSMQMLSVPGGWTMEAGGGGFHKWSQFLLLTV